MIKTVIIFIATALFLNGKVMSHTQIYTSTTDPGFVEFISLISKDGVIEKGTYYGYCITGLEDTFYFKSEMSNLVVRKEQIKFSLANYQFSKTKIEPTTLNFSDVNDKITCCCKSEYLFNGTLKGDKISLRKNHLYAFSAFKRVEFTKVE